MIKQDNRPRTDFQDQRFETLQKLLQSDSENESVPTDFSEKQKQEKIVFISVNGNNNIVSTEKSRYTAKKNGRKSSLYIIIAGCLLFF